MIRFLSVTIAALLAVILLVFLPIELPYSIEVPGRIVSLKEWVLVRGQDGRLVSTLYDNALGTVESYAVTQVDRGDHVVFKLHPAMVAGASVATGDTVGRIYSNEVDRQLTRLRGELSTERASLRLSRTGEKESVIEEAQLRLLHARKQREQQREEVTRLQALAERKFISDVDMEIAETALRLYEIQVDIAEAQVRTVQTGVREEHVDWVRSRVTALQEEIEMLEKRLAASTLTSPIAGRVPRSFSSDTLAVIQDTTGYVVVLPVKWKDRDHIELKQPVELRLGGFGHSLVGTIESMGNRVHVINGQQIFGVVAIVEAEKGKLAPGLIVRCAVSCAPVRPFEYLWRVLTQ